MTSLIKEKEIKKGYYVGEKYTSGYLCEKIDGELKLFLIYGIDCVFDYELEYSHPVYHFKEENKEDKWCIKPTNKIGLFEYLL